MEDYVSDVESVHVGKDRPPQDESQEPKRIYFGRWLADSSREIVNKYDLKKRRYISTTSMDAELSLVTANMALAAPGKLFFDPFVGTGSFCVAAAHFGALTMGSDIDGRSFRGKDRGDGKPMGLTMNFQQYGLESKFMDAFSSDLTHTPLRDFQFLDGIICDPPYGVREGLRVLGTRDGRAKEPVLIDGVPAHMYVFDIWLLSHFSDINTCSTVFPAISLLKSHTASRHCKMTSSASLPGPLSLADDCLCGCQQLARTRWNWRFQCMQTWKLSVSPYNHLTTVSLAVKISGNKAV